MSNFITLSRSALYSAMASGQEIYVLEGDKLREIWTFGAASWHLFAIALLGYR